MRSALPCVGPEAVPSLRRGSAPRRRRRLRRGGQQLGPNVRHCLSVRQSAGRCTRPCAYVVPRGRPGRRRVRSRHHPGLVDPLPRVEHRRRRGGALGVRHGVGFTARAGGPAGAGFGHRRARGRARERHPHRRRRGRARAAHGRLVAVAGARPDLAGPRLQLLGEVRRHQRHRHRAGGPRPGRGVRPRALRRAARPVRLRGRPRLAPGQRQAARRHRPHLLAPGRRTVHVHGGGPHRAADRDRAAWTSRGPASWPCCTTTSPPVGAATWRCSP